MGVLPRIEQEKFCQAVHVHLLAGKSRQEARTLAYQETVAGGAVNDRAHPSNARKLANKAHVKARIQELADFAATLAGVDRDWALVKLKKIAESNLDDYLSKPDEDGNRCFDLASVPREKIGLIAELHQEQVTETDGGRNEDKTFRYIRKMRLKVHDRIAAINSMARIAGWDAPTKVAQTDAAGNDLPPMTDADRARMIEAIFAKSKSTATP